MWTHWLLQWLKCSPPWWTVSCASVVQYVNPQVNIAPNKSYLLCRKEHLLLHSLYFRKSLFPLQRWNYIYGALLQKSSVDFRVQVWQRAQNVLRDVQHISGFGLFMLSMRHEWNIYDNPGQPNPSRAYCQIMFFQLVVFAKYLLTSIDLFIG